MLTATDLLGVTGAATAQVVVLPAGPLLCGCQPHVALLGALTLAPGAFRAARKGPSVARRRTGTIVGSRLSAAAKVSFAVSRAASGALRGHACVAAPHVRRAAGHRCTRYTLMRGSILLKGRAGADSFRFTGRLRSHALPPASYLLRATAETAAGECGAATAHFGILG